MSDPKRMRYLLEEAADAFADCRSPFETAWLAEHDVSADECFALSEAIAHCIRATVALADVARGKKPQP